ncbi:MAG: hypothetical protein WEE89_18525 [Gemmatimonadota bacterium]
MKLRYFTIPLIAAAALLGGSSARSPQPGLTKDVVMRLTEGGGCKYKCRPCQDPGEHDIVTAVDTTHESSHLETCNEGTCDQHEECEPNFAFQSIEQLRIAVEASADPNELNALLGPVGKTVYYNDIRHSVQVLGCHGNVIANIPIRVEQKRWFARHS